MTRLLRIACIALWLAGLAMPMACSHKGRAYLSEDEMQGQTLFELHCAPCHQDTHPDLRKQPPKLERLFQSKSLPSGAPATDAQVRKTIIEGRGTMPAFDQRLSEEDVDDLLKYLHTLK
ncbi:MAG: cytochrome c [Terriglobia bacterium]